MSANQFSVFIVEDDLAVRDALSLLLGVKGYAVRAFADAESFLQVYEDAWRGCMLIDIRMPGMDGLALQRALLERGCQIPAIVMTGHGNVEAARQAFRALAIDFLEKPIEHSRLIAAIEEAFARQKQMSNRAAEVAEATHLIGLLTPREREVMHLVVTGLHNREIAETLSISARTVEVHKARMMSKLRVTNIPELVRLGLADANGSPV